MPRPCMAPVVLAAALVVLPVSTAGLAERFSAPVVEPTVPGVVSVAVTGVPTVVPAGRLVSVAGVVAVCAIPAEARDTAIAAARVVFRSILSSSKM